MMNAATPIVFDVPSLAHAVLRNASSKPQYVLHGSQIQPSRLHLYSADGVELNSGDERDVMKFDTRVFRPMYQELAPGATMPLFMPEIKQFGDMYQLTWGPFSFSRLPRGEYGAILDWTSERNDYTDDAGHIRKLGAVWLGTVRSPRFKVRAP
jgi:hypothetical protein